MILKKFFLFSLLFFFVASCTDPDESTNLELSRFSEMIGESKKAIDIVSNVTIDLAGNLPISSNNVMILDIQ